MIYNIIIIDILLIFNYEPTILSITTYKKGGILYETIQDFASTNGGFIHPFELKQGFIGDSKKDVLEQIKQRKRELQQRCNEWNSGYGQLINDKTFNPCEVIYEKVKAGDLYAKGSK